MREILISVQNKIAVAEKDAFIVCGNEDYTIKFSFDKEWSSHNFKTALFVFKGKLVPVAFTGNVCSVPIVRNSTILGVGVKSSGGELITTTPAYIPCKLSVEDISAEEIEAPSQSVYDEIVELLNRYIEIDITSLQLKTDERLETDDIDVVGAINEVNEIAKQANKNSQNGTMALAVANEAKENADLANEKMVVKTEEANQLYGTDENGNQVLYPTESVGTKVFVDGQKVNEFNADGKYDKTGGVIGGDVSIQGNLSVSGTTTTKDTETVQVKENVIVANSDGVDLVEDSGFAIKTSTTSAYGIMYSPLGDGVKIGLGSFDENGKFVYDEGEAQFLATRADTLANGNIPQWDNEKNQFVDSGIYYGDVVKFTNYATKNTFGVTRVGNGLNVDPNGSIEVDRANKDEIAGKSLHYKPITPVYLDYAWKVGATTNAETWTDTEKVAACETIGAFKKPAKDAAGYMVIPAINHLGEQTAVRVSYSPLSYALIPYQEGGRIKTNAPIDDLHCVNKKYVDDNFVPKASTSDIRYAYTNQEDGSVYMMPISCSDIPYSLVRRYNMQIKTGTPEADDDVPNKAYVDNAVANAGGGSGTKFYVHTITGAANSPNSDYIVCLLCNVSYKPASVSEIIDLFTSRFSTWTGSARITIAKWDWRGGEDIITCAQNGETTLVLGFASGSSITIDVSDEGIDSYEVFEI